MDVTIQGRNEGTEMEKQYISNTTIYHRADRFL